MSEIEKCVCGDDAFLEGDLQVSVWVCCDKCQRQGPIFKGSGNIGDAAIAAWNHDMRGLRRIAELEAEVARKDEALREIGADEGVNCWVCQCHTKVARAALTKEDDR